MSESFEYSPFSRVVRVFFLSLCVCLYFIFHSDLAVFPPLSRFVENLFGVFVPCLE